MSPARGVAELFRGLFGGLMDEARRAPYTVVAVLGLAAMMAFYVLPALSKAEGTADAVSRLTSEVGGLSNRLTDIRRELVRNRIIDLDGQLYSIEREITRYERAGASPPDWVSTQQRALQFERGVAQRALEVLDLHTDGQPGH